MPRHCVLGKQSELIKKLEQQELSDDVKQLLLNPSLSGEPVSEDLIIPTMVSPFMPSTVLNIVLEDGRWPTIIVPYYYFMSFNDGELFISPDERDLAKGTYNTAMYHPRLTEILVQVIFHGDEPMEYMLSPRSRVHGYYAPDGTLVRQTVRTRNDDRIQLENESQFKRLERSTKPKPKVKRLNRPVPKTVRKGRNGCAIPRPPNAWILYRQAKYAEFSAKGYKYPLAEISKLAGQQWHAETEDVKRYWRNQASLKAREHKEKYPDYTYQPRRSEEIRRRNRVDRDSAPVQYAITGAATNLPAFGPQNPTGNMPAHQQQAQQPPMHQPIAPQLMVQPPPPQPQPPQGPLPQAPVLPIALPAFQPMQMAPAHINPGQLSQFGNAALSQLQSQPQAGNESDSDSDSDMESEDGN